MGAIGSFVKSLFYPDHYAWAMETRRGVGLSYIFTILTLLVYGYIITLCLAGGFYTTLDTINSVYDGLAEEVPQLESLSFLGLERGTMFLVFLPMLLIFILGIFFHLFSVVNAIFIANPMNLLSGGEHDFAAMLRVSSYIVVIVTFLTGLLLYLFPAMQTMAGLMMLALLVAYNLFGIIYTNVMHS